MQKNVSSFGRLVSGILGCLLVFLIPGAAFAQTTFRVQGSNNEQIAYLLGTIAQLQRQLDDLEGGTRGSSYQAQTDVTVTTRGSSGVDDTEATLLGTVDLNGESEATVWFQYGSQSSLGNETRRLRITDDRSDVRTFERDVFDLRRGTTYYYRAVAEDERGRRDYGSIRSFVTDGRRSSSYSYSSNGDSPTVETGGYDSITRSTARLFGEVDMEDFNNGITFFVVGRDEEKLEDAIDGADRFAEVNIENSGFKFTKQIGLDTSASYVGEIEELFADTQHYFVMCVEYLNDDDDFAIECGDIESFRTSL